METGDYYNPMFLGLEEQTIRETPHSGAATIPVDDRKLQRMFCDCLDRSFDCQGETLPKLRADIVVPRPRIQQIFICLWSPNDGEDHGLLNRPDLTCCHGITSEGFCSWRAMR